MDTLFISFFLGGGGGGGLFNVIYCFFCNFKYLFEKVKISLIGGGGIARHTRYFKVVHSNSQISPRGNYLSFSDFLC